MKKIKIYILGLFMLYGGIASAQFITTWKTDNNGSSSDDQITIPTFGGGYNYTVDWGDGMNDTGVNGNITHTYAIAGTYTVTITEAFPRIYFNNGGDGDKILTIEQWGTNPWTTMASAFSGCSFLTIATGAGAPNLSFVTNLTEMFRNTDFLNSDLSSWDVSNITTMRRMFRFAQGFNGNIGSWDVRAVLDMSEMFIFAEKFNQNIGAWEVGSVTNMSSMFFGAFAFDQDISFKPGGGNNGNNAWNTANVTNMSRMFDSALSFNQNIGDWDVSSVTNMSSMFFGASAFNQNISGWNISGVTDLSSLFRNATAFNQDLSGWNMYFSNITKMNSMFEGATAFNQVISGWNVSNVTDMSSMFENSTFNPDLSSWDVSAVENFNAMFQSNTAFNQNISGWVVTSATDMGRMFGGASSFNQNLSNWDVSNVNIMSFMLSSSGLSVNNYDNLLIGWSGLSLRSGVSFGASGLMYCSAETERQSIIDNYGWGIFDAGQGCINIFEGNDTTGPEILNGQPEIFDFGSGALGVGKFRNFTIESRVSADITNLAFSFTGTAFSIVSPPTTITTGIPLTISIDLSGANTGTFTETLTITADNLSAGPFVFTITGVITATAQPEITVFEGSTTTGNIILDGDISGLNIGSELRGTDATRQIIIENKGSDLLDITSFSVSGFSLDPSTPTTIPIDGTLVITITLDGTISSSLTEILTINSNDADEAVFDFLIVGTILGPEIEVFDGPNRFSYPEILNGQATAIDFGSSIEGTSIVRQLTIANLGQVDLAISNINISGTAFSSAASVPLVLLAVDDGFVSRITFNITLNGTIAGTFNETITIVNDDDDKSSFSFNLTGEITTEPKVYWTDNNEINRTSLDGSAFQQYHSEPLYSPRGIEVDTLNKLVYWSNEWGQIRKADIGPTGLVNTLDFMNDGIDLNREMAGLALDVAGDNIYWISAYDGTIKMAKLFEPDPANVTTTDLVVGLSNPIGIAIDPTSSFIYYTENVIDGSGNNIASLHRVDTDGSNDEILTSQTLTGQQYTYNDVVIDVASNNIYWTASNNDILSPNGNIYVGDLADVAGTISSITVANNAPYGIDLDAENGMIYWIETGATSEIVRANIDGSSQIILQSGSPNLGSPLFIGLDISQPVTTCQTLPTADAGSDVLICSTDNVNLSGSIGGGATSSLWTSSGDGVFSNAILPNAVYTAGTSDVVSGLVTLTFTANAANCTPVTDQMIVEISLPISVIDQSATVNVAESIMVDVLNGSFINSGDVITTTLLTQPQKGTVIINSNGSIEYTALEGFVGADSFDFQVENQCNSIASAAININIPNTAPTFSNGTATTIPGAPVTINITDLITDLNGNIDLSSIEIIQQPGSGASATLDVDNNLVVDYTGMIFFGTDEVVIRVCDTGGACSEASIFITVEALPIEAYNAVSPNGDGRHDFLEFRYIEAYPENEVKVFNRWGDVVFTIESYNNVDKIFAGSSNIGGSNELPTGTYYYTVTLKTLGGEVQTVNGFFELRR